MLRDCIVKDLSQAELILLGSEAAYEAARNDRDRVTQAILELDPSFVCREEWIDVLETEQCLSLIAALGVGILRPGAAPAVNAKLFDIEKLRYGKVIIVTERGEVGRKMRNEVIRFFLRYMHPLVDAGHVFVLESSLEPGFTQKEFVDGILNPVTRKLKVVLGGHWETAVSGLD